VLRGENPVLEWMKGTALRPLLARLEGAEREEFLRELDERFRSAYPAREGVTLFPFPRLFFIATGPA
jgi:trans-aconitate 2-methyltransferase